MGLYDQLNQLDKAAPPAAKQAGEKRPAKAPKSQSKSRQRSSIAQQATQSSKQVSNKVSRILLKQPTTDQVEDLSYRLRRVQKVRVNADVPVEWKDQLSDIAHELKVGNYELVTYIIGQFLGRIGEEPESS